MKVYRGRRLPNGDHLVTDTNGCSLEPRLDLYNHSPTGFSWGYSGSGPAQLALAILADYFKDDEEALSYHQEFKRKIIAGIQSDEWELTEAQVISAIESIKLEMAGI